MENDLLLEPIKFFEGGGREKHQANSNEYFDDLVKRSGMNVEENRETVRKYNAQLEVIANLDKKISKYKLVRGLLIFSIIVGVILMISGINSGFENAGSVLSLLVGVAMIGTAGYFIFAKVNKIIKNFDEVKSEEERKAQELLNEAYSQMASLNALFDDNDTHKVIEKTIPEFSFSKNFSLQLAREFAEKNDFIDIMDDENSVIDTLAGTFMENPFLYQRYKVHTMGTETYRGSLTISWIEYYTDSEGNRCSRRRTETLYASLEKPKPYYTVGTHLNYGAQGAPDLSFSRDAQHTENLSDKAVARKVKSGEKQLQKQARKAVKTGGTFTEMANSEFDVLFGASDRDNEVQFRMMFTPLAQRNMVSLVRSKTGYGDDFSFIKKGRFNYICSEHAQNWDMDTSAERYRSYDVDASRETFVNFNNEYFKSVFFDFAPLFSVPLYQQKPVQSLDPITEYECHYTPYEYEALANSIGESAFAHSETATDVILKTQYAGSSNATDKVAVTAYSYAACERVDYVSVYGGDGEYHDVPVPWIEYIPLKKTSYMAVKEFGYSERELTEKMNGKFEDVLSRYAEKASYSHGLFAYALGEEDSVAAIDKELCSVLN